MSVTMNSLEARLLEAIQDAIPLNARPYAQIGDRIGLTENEVLDQLRGLKQPPRRVIRQISAIFDSGSLGYKSTLVAAKVDPDRLEEAAAIISKHPGVSHNYQRENAYNLWYTLAVPPDSKLGMEGTVQRLHELSGAIATRMLPTLKLFKIGVKFNLGAAEDAPAPAKKHVKHGQPKPPTTDEDKRMIRVLQQDLPLIERPFDNWAEQAGVSVETLLGHARTYQDVGYMRRFSAVLHHREAGFTANAMGVWAVAPEGQESFGAVAGSHPAVSHCYLRPSYPDWPFSIFTMVHATNAAACEAVLAEISRNTGVTEYRVLYSTREFKKTRVQYFLGDTADWEAAHIA